MRIVSLHKSIFLFIFLSALMHASCLFAIEPQTDLQWEYEQKTKIIKYLIGKIIWPKDSIYNQTFNICLLGNLDYSKPIESINGEVINNLKVSVSKSPSIKKLPQHCQIIYLAKSAQAQSDKLISSYAGQPVLLLGDMDSFALAGGSMNFIVANDHIGLTINNVALKTANLQFDFKGFKITVMPQEKDLGK